ncbi:MAG: YeeE/YedE family protein [Planctomycetes bacterium]|nr:YeeE/YedE family protein [Planctomycetota bacterium]
MNLESLIAPAIGGTLIGLASGGMVLLNGRVPGISGVVYGVIKPVRGEISWRVAFLAGLVAGGIVLSFVYPIAVGGVFVANLPLMIVAGLLVGFGTRLGGGCTSGHGVCGMSRFSGRSTIAVMVFMAVAIVTVFVLRKVS